MFLGICRRVVAVLDAPAASALTLRRVDSTTSSASPATAFDDSR